jgi:hypothetical protein
MERSKTHPIKRIRSKVVFLHIGPAGRTASTTSWSFSAFPPLGLICSVVDPDEFNPDGFNPDTTLQIIWISASDTDLYPVVPQIHPDPDSNPHHALSQCRMQIILDSWAQYTLIKKKYYFPLI